MVNIARLGPQRLEDKRQKLIEQWRKRKEDLRPKEKEELKKQLHPEVAKVVGDQDVLFPN